MATKYVDNSGTPPCSDVPGNGSEANPWCTISYAASQISGGDVVEVKTGTYDNPGVIIDGLNGTSGAPTTFKAFGTDTPLIQGAGVHTGRVRINNASWAVIEGFELTLMNHCIFVDNSTNVTVRNNHCHNIGQEGIHFFNNSSPGTIDNNQINDTGEFNELNGEGVYVGTGSAGPADSTNNVTVKNNLIFNVTHEAVDIKPGTHDCIVENNIIHDANTEPTWPNFWGAIQIEESTAGVQDWPSDPLHIVRNNTVYNSKTAIRLGTGVTCYNNVVYNVPATFFGIYVDDKATDGHTRTIYHNTIDDAAADAVKIDSGTTDVKNNIGPTTTDNIATDNAFYFDVANDDYHIVVGSTPVDTGLDLTSTVPTDLEGKTRPSVTPDVGAYELVDDWYAASCIDVDVQAAIDEASDGHTVLVPPGACIWDARVDIIGKGITLQGAGVGQTVITEDVLAFNALEIVPSNAHSVIRVTGLTFDRNGTDKSGNSGTINISGVADASNAFRVDNIELLELGGTGIGIFMNGFEISGVFDNCTIQMNSGSGDKSIRLFGDGSGDSVPFSRGLDLGSDKFIFFEDCTFTYAAAEDGALDAFGGARYVFRHNTVAETGINHHGADSGGFRGIHSFEIYENTFNKVSAPVIRAAFFRSATGVVFNNTWTGNYDQGINLANFRSRPEIFAPWGQCDGSSIWDENQPAESGYACLDQIGHVFTDVSGGSNTLDPLYLWTNSEDGSPVDVVVSEVAMEDHIKPDRDYYVEDVTFDGTSGVGVGLLSARPSTCTIGVGYWGTDQSILYRCTATDTWTSYYTPFTYPHPLRGEEAPPSDPWPWHEASGGDEI